MILSLFYRLRMAYWRRRYRHFIADTRSWPVQRRIDCLALGTGKPRWFVHDALYFMRAVEERESPYCLKCGQPLDQDNDWTCGECAE